MAYWDTSYGVLGYVVWRAGMRHMAYWDTSYGVLGYVIRRAGIRHMAYWDTSYGVLGCVIWRAGIRRMACWGTSYSVLGYVIWRTGIRHMACWDTSYGVLGYVIWHAESNKADRWAGGDRSHCRGVKGRRLSTEICSASLSSGSRFYGDTDRQTDRQTQLEGFCGPKIRKGHNCA